MRTMTHTDNTALPLQDFFFRTADRMRVEGCANAIANEGQSLVLYSPHEPLLDHYLALLLERLRRQTPEPRVEVYFPTNTDALIARFNDVLASQTVKQATRQPQDNGNAQIWVVHDTQHLPDQEIQLMARLIQNFPGANIRAILLMTGNNPQKASLAALGRKVLRWDIEAPTPEQAQLALDMAAQNGQLQAVTQLLQRIGRLPASSHQALLETDPEPMRADAAPLILQAKPGVWARLAVARSRWVALPGQLRQRLQWRDLNALLRSGNKNTRRVVLAIGAALVLSVGLTAWLQPGAFKGSPKPSKAEAHPPVAAEQAAASAPAVASSAPASEPVTEVPDESQQMQAWVKSLPRDSFLIQHGNVMTYAKAVEVKKGVPPQSQPRIVAAYRPGDTLAHFVVVSGPYDSLGKAYESIKRREATKNSWVRATHTLQAQVNGPTRPQEIRP